MIVLDLPPLLEALRSLRSYPGLHAGARAELDAALVIAGEMSAAVKDVGATFERLRRAV